MQTTGVPRLLELLAAKLRRVNGIPVGSPDEVLVTNGGIHALYIVCQALLEPGDEVIVPDPEWPPCVGNIAAARGGAGAVPAARVARLALRPRRARVEDHAADARDLPQLAAQPDRRRAHAADVEAIAAIVRKHDLWVISDEAYEDVIFDEREHVSPASLPGHVRADDSALHVQQAYAMTGLRLGYVAVHDRDAPRADEEGAVLHRQQRRVGRAVRRHRRARRIAGLHRGVPRGAAGAARPVLRTASRARGGDVFTGAPPAGAFYAFLRIDPGVDAAAVLRLTGVAVVGDGGDLITRGRIGCVPGVDFGANGEGYIRFCFARDRAELEGALASMRQVLMGDGVLRA